MVGRTNLFKQQGKVEVKRNKHISIKFVYSFIFLNDHRFGKPTPLRRTGKKLSGVLIIFFNYRT